MKAFAVTTYGPDGLREIELPRPTLGAGDERVEVRAASINPLDKMVRNGEFKQLIPYDRPFVLGPDLAGVVTEVGPVMAVLSRKVRRRARRLGVRYSFSFMRADGARLASLATLYDDGTLRPVLDRTFAFDETIAVMAYHEQGKAHGKIVVTR